MVNVPNIPARFRTTKTIKLEKLGRIRFRAVEKKGWFATGLEWVAEEELMETFVYLEMSDNDLDLDGKLRYTRTFWRFVEPEDCLMLQFTVPAT